MRRYGSHDDQWDRINPPARPSASGGEQVPLSSLRRVQPGLLRIQSLRGAGGFVANRASSAREAPTLRRPLLLARLVLSLLRAS
jgi:hypothetical protein